MDYESLMEKYKTGEVFIYGRSVMRIVDTHTYMDADTKKTDFIFKTERNNQGKITITHDENT